MNSIKNHSKLEKILKEDDQDLNTLYSMIKINENCCLSAHDDDSLKSSMSKFFRNILYLVSLYMI